MVAMATKQPNQSHVIYDRKYPYIINRPIYTYQICQSVINYIEAGRVCGGGFCGDRQKQLRGPRVKGETTCSSLSGSKLKGLRMLSGGIISV